MGVGFVLLLALAGCLGEAQPVKASLHNAGGSDITVHLQASQDGATIYDQTFQVGGGATVERTLGTGTMTVTATYSSHTASGGTQQDVDAHVSLTLGGGDCGDGTAVAAFSFAYDAGANPPFRNDGVKVLCA